MLWIRKLFAKIKRTVMHIKRNIIHMICIICWSSASVRSDYSDFIYFYSDFMHLYSWIGQALMYTNLSSSEYKTFMRDNCNYKGKKWFIASLLLDDVKEREIMNFWNAHTLSDSFYLSIFFFFLIYFLAETKMRIIIMGAPKRIVL